MPPVLQTMGLSVMHIDTFPNRISQRACLLREAGDPLTVFASCSAVAAVDCRWCQGWLKVAPKTRGGEFASIAELEAAIHDHLLRHNADPKPFGWTGLQ